MPKTYQIVSSGLLNQIRIWAVETIDDPEFKAKFYPEEVSQEEVNASIEADIYEHLN